MVNRLSFQYTFYHNTAFYIGNPDRCFSFSISPREPVSPSHENAGATITGTHWCDDEINLPLSIPTTDVYH